MVFDPSVTAIVRTRAATVIEELPRIEMDIGLATGKKVFATTTADDFAGESTTIQQGWSMVTTSR
jgi:hypothetical protein